MPHGLTIAGVPIFISTYVAAGKAWAIDSSQVLAWFRLYDAP